MPATAARAAHGTGGAGRPPPQTKEAGVPTVCNQLDVTLAAASHSVAGEGPWTDTVRSLRRRFYRGNTTEETP